MSTGPSRPAQPPAAPTVLRGTLCPYCGKVSADARRCDWCRGFFDPLSRQASQNAMGPWFIRDEKQPFRPGCSYETLRGLVRRGKVTAETVIRGPGSRQLWSFAGRTPGVSHLLGMCHNCRGMADAEQSACASCGASFEASDDRQHLGLAPVHALPGQVPAERIADAIAASSPMLQTPVASASTATSAPMTAASPIESPAVAVPAAGPPPLPAEAARGMGGGGAFPRGARLAVMAVGAISIVGVVLLIRAMWGGTHDDGVGVTVGAKGEQVETTPGAQDAARVEAPPPSAPSAAPIVVPPVAPSVAAEPSAPAPIVPEPPALADPGPVDPPALPPRADEARAAEQAAAPSSAAAPEPTAPITWRREMLSMIAAGRDEATLVAWLQAHAERHPGDAAAAGALREAIRARSRQRRASVLP